MEAAIRNLRTAGRLGPEELSPSQQADVVRNAVQKLDQLMSEDKDVMALVRVATTESGALQKLRTQV